MVILRVEGRETGISPGISSEMSSVSSVSVSIFSGTASEEYIELTEYHVRGPLQCNHQNVENKQIIISTDHMETEVDEFLSNQNNSCTVYQKIIYPISFDPLKEKQDERKLTSEDGQITLPRFVDYEGQQECNEGIISNGTFLNVI